MRFVIVALIIFFAIECEAQARVNSTLNLEISEKLTCDGMKVPIDKLALAAHENSAKKRVIVITPNEADPQTALRFYGELMFAIQVIHRFGSEPPPVKFLPPGHNSTNAALFSDIVEKVPVGLTDQPILTPLPKGLFFGATFSEGCSTIKPKDLGAFLSVNPGFKTLIYVYDDNHARRRITADRWVRILTTKYKIQRERIRILLRNEDHSNGWSTNYESVQINS